MKIFSLFIVLAAVQFTYGFNVLEIFRKLKLSCSNVSVTQLTPCAVFLFHVGLNPANVCNSLNQFEKCSGAFVEIGKSCDGVVIKDATHLLEAANEFIKPLCEKGEHSLSELKCAMKGMHLCFGMMRPVFQTVLDPAKTHSSLFGPDNCRIFEKFMDCAVTSSENCLGTKSDSTLRKTADWILHKTCPTANDDESVSVAAKNITSDSQSKLLNDDEDWSDDIQF